MKRLLQIVLPLAVLVLSVWIGLQIMAAKPQAERRTPPPKITEVDAIRLQHGIYPVRIYSQGTVQPRTESTLIPELSGRITEISENFHEGGFFEQGDVLARIDPRDYQIAVTVAEAELARVKAALAEEEARAQVAEREWQQLKRSQNANQLVLRKPQLAAARAAVLSAEAQLARAQLNLERTHISAPYAGRVLEQNIGVGQYVGPGTVLARIYAVDYVEIRLPLSNRQLAYINLPERYRGDPEAGANLPGPTVTLSAHIGTEQHHWQGQLIRTEGAIDTQSRQLFVVVQVDDPYGRGPAQRPPLRIGQYVQAEIAGNVLTDVFVIPRSALREGDQVLLVSETSQLERRAVQVLWSDAENAVIGAGLQENELLLITPLSTAAEGMPVKVREQPAGQDAIRSTMPTRAPSEPSALSQQSG